MDSIHYKEMEENVNRLIGANVIQNKRIYLFGHCNATEELVRMLSGFGIRTVAILDNNSAKHGKAYDGISIQPPEVVLSEPPEHTLVCIVARAYEAMAGQLKRIGFAGQILKLVDYNSYAEYSLSKDTIEQKKLRMERGKVLLEKMEQKYPGYFRFLCPFSALGDIYFMMSYLPYYLQKRNIPKCVIGVIGRACAEVVTMFGAYDVEIFVQKDMDEAVQAALYTKDENTFIVHQDRPYVVNLHRALYIKCISLEKIYCCGIFGLPENTKPYKPVRLEAFDNLGQIRKGEAVILSPYAKSVTALSDALWRQITDSYIKQGFQCFTNVAGNEQALPGTIPISPKIAQLRSVVEWAGTFIGLRSGICDVIREADCRKMAIYPDYQYCDTKWKAIDMYALEGWENIVAEDGFEWKKK